MSNTDSVQPIFYTLIGAFMLLLLLWLLRSAFVSSGRKRHNNRAEYFSVRIVEVSPTREVSARQGLWKALTEREKKVAQLATQDKSDMEIAQELHVSVRTVESHLYRAYRKLKIRSRHELKYIIQHLDN